MPQFSFSSVYVMVNFKVLLLSSDLFNKRWLRGNLKEIRLKKQWVNESKVNLSFDYENKLIF